MSRSRVRARDLPLGRLAEHSEYNRLVAGAIRAKHDGHLPSQVQIERMLRRQAVLFERIEARKEPGMQAFARHAARRYGFPLAPGGGLEFKWKRPPFNRIGHASDFYASVNRELVPVSLLPTDRRVVVFATGRAFAEQNARLGYITKRESVRRARDVMSAQVHLIGTRLVPPDQLTRTRVVAVAYDMVTSEEETPALRIHSLLDPSFTHPTSVLAAERIFGPLVADAASRKNGSFVRRRGRLRGHALPEDEILENVRGLVLVGASIGCVVSFQAVRWLDRLLEEFGVSRRVRDAACRSILIINVGPTTLLPKSPTTNLLSIISRNDEFVLAGNDVAARILTRDRSGLAVVPEPATNGHHVTVILDSRGTISRDNGALVFDPSGSHYGHSMKTYTNAARDGGLASVVERAITTPGPYRLQDLFDDAAAAGELRVAAPWPRDAEPL